MTYKVESIIYNKIIRENLLSFIYKYKVIFFNICFLTLIPILILSSKSNNEKIIFDYEIIGEKKYYKENVFDEIRREVTLRIENNRLEQFSYQHPIIKEINIKKTFPDHYKIYLLLEKPVAKFYDGKIAYVINENFKPINSIYLVNEEFLKIRANNEYSEKSKSVIKYLNIIGLFLDSIDQDLNHIILSGNNIFINCHSKSTIVINNENIGLQMKNIFSLNEILKDKKEKVFNLNLLNQKFYVLEI